MSNAGSSAVPRAIDGYRIPSHGKGLLKPFPKGISGNPQGRNQSEYHQVRRMCAEISLPATVEMWNVFNTTDDPRTKVVIWKEILDRGIGPPRDHSDEDQRTVVNLDNLSDDERALLAKLMGKVLPKDAP